MPLQSTFQRAFSAGELAPALAARADLAKYGQGLRTCRNFIVQRDGGVANRAGTRFITSTRDSSPGTFLLRYLSDVDGGSILIEAGHLYLRFYSNGALVTLAGVTAWSGATGYVVGSIAASGGVNYYCIKAHTNEAPPNATYWYPMPGAILELPTPFPLPGGFNWSQRGNVITLTNQLVAPYELIYGSLTDWAIQPVTLAPQVNPPTGVVITPGGAGTLSFSYLVTSAAPDTYEESIASVVAQVNTIVAGTPTQPIVLNWTAPATGPAPVAYYVYCDPAGNGTFGFIGTATGATTFNDTGLTPDFTQTPPIPRVLFNATGEYPDNAGYYQQRRFFANTVNNPDAIYGSRTGFPSNFTISSPIQDDDALTFKIAGKQRNPVRHMVGLRALVVMTDGGEWTIGQVATAYTPTSELTPSNLPANQNTYIGALGGVPPAAVGDGVIYVQARGSRVHDLNFEADIVGLGGQDLTLFAGHLFDGFTINALDYQQIPHSIVWACRSDGVLLGLTYIREQQEWGWHRHDTGNGDVFEDVCVVPESTEDAVYLIVRRALPGAVDYVRYIERLESRLIVNFDADAFFVDAGLTYTGSPATTIAGLDHLDGAIVAMVADGVVIFNGDPTNALAPQFTVSGGTIGYVLPTPASIIHAGLPIQFADFETLDLDVAGLQSEIRDKLKRVSSLSLLLAGSCRTYWAGPSSDKLTQQNLTPDQQGLGGTPFTGQEALAIEVDYTHYGRVFVRQIDPLPLEILGVLPNLEVGG